MSDPTVIAYVTKLLCSHGGRLPRDQLSEFLDLPTEQIDQILQEEPQKFPQVGDLVLARNPVRICTKYLKNEPEEECDKLHMCRHYLQGKCWRRKRPHCNFSHDILSDHNQLVLKANEISGLNDNDIKVLLLQNDNQMLPEVCVKYLHDTCDLGKDCTRLHVCGYFTRGACNRRTCNRSHNLLECGSDLLFVRNRMPEVSVENFQMLCTVKHNEHLQSQRREYEKNNSAARGGRGRGRYTNRKNGDSRDVSQNRPGRQKERSGPNSRGRSSSRPMSKSVERLGWSGEYDDDEDEDLIITRLDRIMDDWFTDSSNKKATKCSPIVQPLMSLGGLQPTPTVRQPTPTTNATSCVVQFNRSDIQSKLPTTSLKVSSQPGISNSIVSSTSTLSAPQPKPTTTPLTTAGQANAPPVNVSSVAATDKPMSDPLVNPSTVPLVPPRRAGRLVDPLLTGPSVPQEKPVTTSLASTYSVLPAVTTNKVVTSPTVSPSNAIPPSYLRLVDSTAKDLSVPQVKRVTTSIVSPYNVQPAVTINKVDTSPAVSPSSALPPSYLRLVDSTPKGPSVPQEKTVQYNVRSQPATDDKLAYSHTSVYRATYLSPKMPEPDTVPDICLFNVWKHCKLGKCCPDMHYYLPYCWQINRGTGWEEISNMEEIEKQYCDPKLDRIPSIDFLTMRSGAHHVRRLSTVSSVVKPSEYVLTTEWLWYWKDEHGTWTQYGHYNVKQVSSNILSSDLENVYLSDPTADIPFIAGNQSYEIKFKEMKQKNIAYRTEKDVRRRPKFQSFEDVKLLKGSTKSAAASSPLRSGTSPQRTDIYPRTWEAGAMPEIGCKKVLVSDTSSEFSEIVSSFTRTVSGHVIKNMWRLQNPSLWQVFQWQKEQMKKVNSGGGVKEIRLFHGTEKMHIDAICNQNFDWRICGTHGTVYGQGSYFARDASYSHNYSTPTPSGTRTMFVARVLVGDYVLGNPHMKRPPQRPDSSSRYYDSCVDDVFSPSIFVVFEKHQIYPEYLLEYQEEQKKSCVVC